MHIVLIIFDTRPQRVLPMQLMQRVPQVPQTRLLQQVEQQQRVEQQLLVVTSKRPSHLILLFLPRDSRSMVTKYLRMVKPPH